MQKRLYNVAVIGATGNAGHNTLKILAERKFPVDKICAIASDRSVGKKVSFNDHDVVVEKFDTVDFSDIDIAILCAGSSFSKSHAKYLTDNGVTIIDKTAAFRLEPKVPLVVPEINAEVLEKGAPLGIISTPNCVAVPLVMALKALNKIAPVERVVASTYQSVSGAGKKAIDELYNQTKSIIATTEVTSEVFSKQIAFNVIPSIGNIYANGVSDEEDKIASELRKILMANIGVAVTCVRVPVFIGHGISVACEFSKEISVSDATSAFESFPGMLVIDRRKEEIFATPLDIQGEDAVFVSRIRKDSSVKNGLLFWVVSDNLRKGAALNSVQIAENMIRIDPTLKIFKKKK